MFFPFCFDVLVWVLFPLFFIYSHVRSSRTWQLSGFLLLHVFWLRHRITWPRLTGVGLKTSDLVLRASDMAFFFSEMLSQSVTQPDSLSDLSDLNHFFNLYRQTEKKREPQICCHLCQIHLWGLDLERNSSRWLIHLYYSQRLDIWCAAKWSGSITISGFVKTFRT